MKVTIPGHCYSLKNHRPIFRAGKGGRPFLGKDKALRDYQRKATDILRAARVPEGMAFGPRPYAGPVHIFATYYYAGVEPDALGFLETLFDCIQEAGIVVNDRQLVPAGNPAVLRVHVKKAEERVEVTLTPLLFSILEGAKP